MIQYDITNYIFILVILLISINTNIIPYHYTLLSFYYVNIINVFASFSIIFIDFIKYL